VIASSEEKAALLQQMATSYTAGLPPAKCARITIVRKASGAAEAALARGWNPSVDGPQPDVWSPAATTWSSLLTQHLSERSAANLVPDNLPSLCESPLVIGMPQPMAKALGWSQRPIGWSDIFQLAAGSGGWGRVGNPDWGAFRLGKTNPLISTSGLHALIATYAAASGTPAPLSAATLDRPEVVSSVKTIEATVVHYGNSASSFLLNLRAADDQNEALKYVSAVALEEKEVWDYNQGNLADGKHLPPKIPLLALYPSEGTLLADHPYIVLQSAWVSQTKRALAEDFLRFLQADAQQLRFLAAGFRDQHGNPGSAISPANGLLPQEPRAFVRSPAASVVAKIQGSWPSLRKRARVLVLIDLSSSAGGTPRSQISQAITDALGGLGDDDSVGLWVMPGASSQAGYQQLVPVGALAQNRAALQGAIGGVPTASGGPALYRTLRAGLAAMTGAADPSRINAIVLVSCGANQDPTDTDLNGLLRELETQSQAVWVRVFTVACQQQPNGGTLDQIGRASRGGTSTLTPPGGIRQAILDVLSNF
jgi:Ca-activated chloride channel homolog